MSKRAPAGRSGRSPSQRQLRVGEEIRHLLADMIARVEFRDPDLAGQSITVTEVRVSPDLRNATVYVTPLAGQADVIVPALQRAAGFMRSRLASALTLRHTPDLTFAHDTSFDQAQRIDALLQRTASDHDGAGSGGGDGG